MPQPATQHRAERDDRQYREAFGLRIRLLRTAQRLTQDQLAARASVTRNYVSAIERGRQGIDLLRLRQLADALKVPLPALVTDDETSPTALVLPSHQLAPTYPTPHSDHA